MKISNDILNKFLESAAKDLLSYGLYVGEGSVIEDKLKLADLDPQKIIKIKYSNYVYNFFISQYELDNNVIALNDNELKSISKHEIILDNIKQIITFHDNMELIHANITEMRDNTLTKVMIIINNENSKRRSHLVTLSYYDNNIKDCNVVILSTNGMECSSAELNYLLDLSFFKDTNTLSKFEKSKIKKVYIKKKKSKHKHAFIYVDENKFSYKKVKIKNRTRYQKVINKCL